MCGGSGIRCFESGIRLDRCARFGGGQLAVDGELISLPFQPICFLYLFSKFLGNDGREDFEIIDTLIFGRVQI